jgi:hypothetical protein
MAPAGRPEIGHPINVRLGDELLTAVDAKAHRLGQSRAGLIRTILADYLLTNATIRVNHNGGFMADLIADDPEDTWLTRKQVANRQKMPEATLAQWASGPERRGPKFAKFGKHVRYRLDHVIAWENAQFSDNDDQADSAPDMTD